jgi:hypothetical protein
MLQARTAESRKADGGKPGSSLAVALLGEGWPHTLPLCLAAGAARLRGADLVEVPFLGLRAEQRKWSLLVGAALTAAGMALAWRTSWGMMLRPAGKTWELFPWEWLREYALLAAARMRREGWQMEAMVGRGLRFRGAKGEIWLLWAPPGRAWRAGLQEGSGLQVALVSPLPWEERVPAGMAVLAPPEMGPWLARALR